MSVVNGHKVTVCIKDFGIGMSEATRQKVFERFFRASDNIISAFPGLGLGLFIAADIRSPAWWRNMGG